MRYQRFIIMLLLLSFPVMAASTEVSDDEWFDESDDLQARIARVNGGDLVFLAEPPLDPVHHHHSRITLDAESLDNGWVTMVQCHSHLDAVARTQVVYHQTRARDLAILSYDNIERAWVEGHTVQLAEVGRAASICIRARTRMLEFNEDGSFSLRGGPFMRRFLDGYYPMEVSIRVHYPADLLTLQGFDPTPQPGYRLQTAPGEIELDARFAGNGQQVQYRVGRAADGHNHGDSVFKCLWRENVRRPDTLLGKLHDLPSGSTCQTTNLE